ncbi:uncharacterized protein N7482_005064 [Penicillium canariense]|uniref:Uncharacterized protein n=1 Tax=Penicillium canariense TaxID=189055 RepID=A0A9W9LN32_9EURO|nr:uncharacterized protein N7482_005064 [Penicillium canariense]KAJ5166283.1 hypothetical protein N7482_005064 [Penicillium canariense]
MAGLRAPSTNQTPIRPQSDPNLPPNSTRVHLTFPTGNSQSSLHSADIARSPDSQASQHRRANRRTEGGRGPRNTRDAPHTESPRRTTGGLPSGQGCNLSPGSQHGLIVFSLES